MRAPELVPEITFDQLIGRYNLFIKDYSYSQLVPLAQIYIGKVNIARKDYQAARTIFENMITAYPGNKEIGAQAVAGIGSSYILEEDYENAIRTYDRITKEYPLTELGLKAPLLKMRYYLQKNTGAEAKQRAYQEAIGYYDHLISDNKGTRMEYQVLKMKASVYLEIEMYREAVHVFGEILVSFASSPYLSSERIGNLVKTINTIAMTQLKDVDLPISIYSKFIELHPDHPYSKILSSMIVNLEASKQDHPAQSE